MPQILNPINVVCSVLIFPNLFSKPAHQHMQRFSFSEGSNFGQILKTKKDKILVGEFLLEIRIDHTRLAIADTICHFELNRFARFGALMDPGS